MKLNIIQDKILDIFKTANDELLHGYVMRILKQDRARAMDAFSDMIGDLQGRYRLKLLEIFMEDGQPDMIPLFLKAIKHEPNKLYAKSMLFIYSNFEHYQAFETIETLEAVMTGEMKPAFDKAVAKLGAKFRHRYYISEFLNHADDPDRINHAAEMMITEPHPDFIPFLNEEIQQPKRPYREHGVRVLSEIGDESALEALFNLAITAFVEKEKADGLVNFLSAKETSELDGVKSLMILGSLAGWDSQESQEEVPQVQAGSIDAVVEKLCVDFEFGSATFQTQIKSFCARILSEERPEELERLQLSRTYEHFLTRQNEMIELVFLAIGEIGHRTGTDGLFKKADAYIPNEDSMRTAFLFSFMGGYRSDDAREQLLSYLDPKEKPEFLNMVLEALSHYQMDTLHPNLAAVAESTGDPGPRKKAIELLIQWGLGEKILGELVKHPADVVRLDAIEALAEHPVPGAAGMLIKTLSGGLSPELTAATLRVLVCFPGDDTLAAVLPFLAADQPAPAREAAIEVLIEIGGPNRFALIVDALAEYPGDERSRVLTAFLESLREILNDNPAEAPPGLVSNPAFWVQILNDAAQESPRLQAVSVLEAVPWRLCECLPEWTKALTGVLDNADVQRKYDEKRRLRLLALEVEEAESQQGRSKEAFYNKKSLGSLLKDLDTVVHYDRVRAFRRLSLLYKPEMPGSGDEQADLVALVGKFFDDYQGSPDLMKIAITLAGKIAHPSLTERIRAILNDAETDRDVAAFAKAALAHLGDAWESDGSIQKIFIMEDAVMMTKMLSRFLKKAGFEVHCANDTDEGLKALAETEYDLLILDFFMSKMDGSEFLYTARQREIAPLWVIFITSTREERIIREINEIGVNGLLLKPFSVEDLIDRINQLAVS